MTDRSRDDVSSGAGLSRLSGDRRSFGMGAIRSYAEQERVLDQRTRALATVPDPGGGSAETRYVRFEVGDVPYAVEQTRVRRVFQALHLARIPSAPPHLRHVLEVDGRIVAVADLGALLSGSPSGIDGSSWIVLVEARRLWLGVLASRIPRIVTIDEGTLTAPPPRDRMPHAACVRGIAPGVVSVIDGERLVLDLRTGRHADLDSQC